MGILGDDKEVKMAKESGSKLWKAMAFGGAAFWILDLINQPEPIPFIAMVGITGLAYSMIKE